jgi:leucyl/phenylalanyl-tRNA--protein transferase
MVEWSRVQNSRFQQVCKVSALSFFSNPLFAHLPGLVAIGGDLSPSRLLRAYQSGIFPWYSEGEPICWWAPDPRAVFPLERVHVPRRLRRTVRSGRFQLTINENFSAVIRGCAMGRAEGTWITPEMIEAYEKLHRLDYAHSIEVWAGTELAGGIYGVALGGFFAGESMFSRQRDASKVAFVHLVERLRSRDFSLFDTQFLTEHTARRGAVEISRKEYLRRLGEALSRPATFT